MMLDLLPQHYEDLIGKPYCRDSLNPAEGLDCWSLVALVYSRAGVILKTPVDAEPEHFAKHAGAMWQRVKPGEEQPGDVAAYCMLGESMDHVGLLIEGDRILHAREKS